MSALTKYDAARNALQVASSVDEVKDIRDKAEAMAAYARQAKDTAMVEWATEIKVRAERRAGQMLAEMPKATGELRNSSRSHDTTTTKTLAEIGISKDQSSRWQKLAGVPDSQFEQAVAAAKEVAGEVTTAAMLRMERANRPEVPADKQIKPVLVVSDELATLRAENERLKEWGTENATTAKEMLAENESLSAIFDQDDKLAASIAECKKLREMNRILEERMRGLMNEKNEAIRAAKSWQRKAEQAMKAA